MLPLRHFHAEVVSFMRAHLCLFVSLVLSFPLRADIPCTTKVLEGTWAKYLGGKNIVSTAFEEGGFWALHDDKSDQLQLFGWDTTKNKMMGGTKQSLPRKTAAVGLFPIPNFSWLKRDEGTVAVWSAVRGGQVFESSKLSGTFGGMSFSKDGKQAYASIAPELGNGSGTVLAIDVSRGTSYAIALQPWKTAPARSIGIAALPIVAVSSEGKVACFRAGDVQMIDPATGQVSAHFLLFTEQEAADMVLQVPFSSSRFFLDPDTFSFVDAKTVRFGYLRWDDETKTRVVRVVALDPKGPETARDYPIVPDVPADGMIKQRELTAVSVSGRLAMLSRGQPDGDFISLWDTVKGEALGQIRLPNEKPRPVVNSMRFSDDGLQLLVATTTGVFYWSGP